MPQSKPMKIQWLNIDGRQVPLVLPQVWDDTKNDWVVTGHVAPLPTTDAAVKSKLEQLEQTQQQILSRLDAGLDTRLTGSMVEIARESPFTSVATGEMFYILGAANSHEVIGDFKEIKIAFFFDNTNIRPVVRVTNNITGGYNVHQEFVDEETLNNGQGLIKIPVMTRRMSIGLRNEQNISRTLLAYSIYGVI